MTVALLVLLYVSLLALALRLVGSTDRAKKRAHDRRDPHLRTRTRRAQWRALKREQERRRLETT